MKKLFGVLSLALAATSFAAFSESSFNYGAMWEGIKDRSDRASLGLSHVAMYIGDANTQWSDRVNQPYNPYWEADMVKFCAQNDITPVFYAYVIAEWDKHLGYSDCDVSSPNHCTNGAETIRNDWQTILWRYGELAKGVASDMGSKKNTIPSIWLIEPDFYQYSVSGDNQRGGQQSGGGIPDAELAGTKFNQIVAAIKQHLPNAKIAVDISPWISNPQGWYSNFDASKIDYMFTSGGRTEGNNSKIRSENNMTWAQASGFLGKKIIADDGYGVGGGAEENYSDWQNVNNLKSRVADGVIGLTIKSPSASFMSWTKSNPISLGNSGSTQQPSSSSNRPSYSSSSSATNTGSGNSNSNLAIKPTRVGPVSQYGQLMTGKNSSGKGQIYGSCDGVKDGKEVQVKGMSLYWSLKQEAVDYWSLNGITTMVNDMKIELVRAAMATSEDWKNGYKGYTQDPTTQTNLVDAVVEAAIKNDIYVIIDWHSHTAHTQENDAKKFFSDMAKKWGSYDNVIFEVYNEPISTDWGTIKNYANAIAKEIRQYSDNLILVGNRNYDQNPQEAIGQEVGYPNVAYTMHYYANSHCWEGNNSWGGACEGTNALKAMNAGLSVFVSEWGTGDADGGGSPNASRNEEWQKYLDKHKLSWANWSASKISEGTAAFSGGSNTSLSYSTSGNMVKGYLASNPSSYAKCGDPAVKPNSSSSVTQSSSGTHPASSSSVALTTANLIDDFEDGDSTAYTGAKDTWFAFTDVGDKGASSIQNVKNATGYDVVYAADNGSKYMAGLKGITLSQGGNEYDPYVTLGLDINGGLVGCKTITYKYKGAGHNLKAVTKGDDEGALSKYNYHKRSVTGSASWQTASVPVSSLSQETGWGNSFALNASNIVKLQWEVKGTASANSLYIDDLACDGMNIVRPTSSSSVASSSSVSSSSAQSSSSVSSSSVASSSSVSLEWAGNAQLSKTSATGVEIGQSNGYSPDRVISKALEVTAGETNVLTFKMKLSGQGPLNISTNIESCSEITSVNTNDVNVTCSFTPASDVSTLTLTVPGGTWQTVTVSDLSVSVKGTPVETVFNPAAENTTQNVVAGNAIEPIVFNFENVSSISVDGLPKGLTAVLDETAKTYTISGTVDAELGTHDYEYTVSVTGVDENTTVTGVIKVTRAPLITVFNPAAENTTQNVVAGQPIAPIVFNFENVSSISVDGLPKGLTAVLDETAKTYTISGTVDAELGTHDYEYTVTVNGLDNDATANGVIKVTRAPIVTEVDLASGKVDQEVVAGNAIEPIVFSYANATSVAVEGLPKGLTAALNQEAKTYTISGTIDAELGTHDYEYIVTIAGEDNDAVVTGTIKVTRAPIVTKVDLNSADADQSIVAGESIKPIVLKLENATSVTVAGLPQGLTAVLSEDGKTYTISGTVDAMLGSHDYEYTVTVKGLDNDATATGVIKVTRAPVVTKVDLNSADADQSIVAGESIKPIVLKLENATSVTVAGLPQGLTAVLSEDGKTYTISGTVDATLGTHDYEYTVTVKGLDNDATANGVIKVTEIVVEESSSSSEEVVESSSSVEESSSSSEVVESSSSEEPVVSSSSEAPESSSSEEVSSSSSIEESSSSSEVVESSSSAEPESSSSSVEEPASSSSEETGAKCIAYTGGNVYKDVCYSSGLIGQETGKCYRVSDASSSQVNASGNNWLGNSSIANNAWWWTEVDCGETPASSSSEEVVESSSSVEENSSSSEVVESSSSEEPVVSSSSEAPESSSSAEPESSSSSVEEPVVSSSSEAPASSSSEEVVESSSSVVENSSSSEDIESSCSEEPESSSSEDPWNMRNDVRPTLALNLNGRALTIVGAQNVNVDVFDMQGRPIRAFRQVSGQVSLDGVKAGHYIVRVREGSNSLTRRIAIR